MPSAAQPHSSAEATRTNDDFSDRRLEDWDSPREELRLRSSSPELSWPVSRRLGSAAETVQGQGPAVPPPVLGRPVRPNGDSAFELLVG